jgi:hypothetical protein
MKKNLRKIPSDILAKTKHLAGNLIVVGCAKKFLATDVQAGCLSHLGINIASTGLVVPPQILPPASQGKYSDRNINGEVIIRKDLPKETHYRSFEAPNWGDSYNGYHTVDVPYEAYPRDFNPPRESEIKIECLNSSLKLSEYLIAFKVEEVLDKTANDFEKQLLENLNLLQENVGACGVEQAGVSLNNYFSSLHVSWEILPPGNKANVLQRLFQGRTATIAQQDVAADRYDFFQKLKAKQLIIGTSGFRRYFGALIEDDLVVFENIEYGNAVYILFNDWKTLSQKSRVELLSGNFGADFERVIHTEGWKEKVEKIIAEWRKSKKKP